MEDISAYLHEHKGWSRERIDEALESWRYDRQASLAGLAGLRIRIDSEGYLVWEKFPEQALIERVRILPEPPVGHTGARSLIWLDPETGSQQDIQTLPADSACGLVVSGKRVFLHSAALEAAPRLALTNVWVDTALPDTRNHHIDLQILAERDLLFVLHREGGVVHIYHLQQRERLASWQIRSPGSAMAINLTFDRGGLKAYLTDNLTPQLWIADLVSLELKLWKSGLGVLGNLLAAPEPGCLYLTILKPHFNLVYFELDTMSAQYSVEIRGEPLTGRRLLAWDPFMADKDADLLFYLASREQSGQTLAVLNMIDTSEVRTIKRVVVRSQSLPVLLVSGPENPFKRHQELDFESWLIENAEIDAGDLEQARAARLVAEAPKAERQPFRVYQPPAEEAGIWEQIDQPAPHIELPPAADEAIVDLICWAFYRLTLTNLRIHGGEIQNLKKLAHRLRLELQAKQALLARLTGVLGRYAFQAPISRAAVLALLAQREGEAVRFEDLCPMCRQRMRDEACEACGYRLELPAEEQFDPDQASAEPADRLLPGQMLIPHPQQPLLLTLNPWRQPLAALALEGVKQLQHAVVLPNQHLLAVDSAGNKLLELSPGGEVLWKAKLALKRPVMCSYYLVDDEMRFLVVDQGNGRVLELDRGGKHHRRYPTLKSAPADKLIAPSDVQLTPSGSWLISDAGLKAVLEVDARGQVLRRFDETHGLIAPVAARRKIDGSTEILDKGLGAVVIFAQAGHETTRFGYWPLADSRFADAEAPHWACLLHNGEWLLLGQNYFLQVAPRQQRLRWLDPLPDLAKDNLLLKVGFSAQTGADLRKQQLDGYLETLRRIELFGRESDEQLGNLARHVQSLSFDAGDWLLHPGELGNALFFVQAGELDVIAPEKDQPVIFQVRAGESCGTQAVVALGDTSWRPGIRVRSNCQLLMLERGEFKKAVVGFPRLFSLVRHLDHEHQRLFRQFRERKIEQAQDKLRIRLNETQAQKFPLFEGAEPEFFEALAEAVHAVAYLPDQTLCQRGESGGTVYLILEGSVGILRQGETTPAVTLGEGELFGEMSLLYEQPRAATVRTLDYCKFFVIEEPALRGLGARFSWFWERLMDLANERRRTNQADWAAFAAHAGLDRADLPIAELPAGPRSDDERLFIPSLYHDAIIGLTQAGEMMWFWGREATRQLFHPSRVQHLDQTLLVTDTGNDRILEIEISSRKTLRKWSGHLKRPSAAALTPEGLLLVADTGNQRLVVMDESGREVWHYGLPEEILQPVYVEITPAGTLLFADAGMHRVYELSLDGQVLWTHGKWRNPGFGPEQLNEPSWAHRLGDGSTLIADAGNQRLVWLEARRPPQLVSLHSLGEFRPHHCQRLSDGDWLAIDPSRERAVRLNRRGEIIWEVSLRFPDAVAAGMADPSASKGAPDVPWVLDMSILAEDGPAAPESAFAAGLASPDEESAAPARVIDSYRLERVQPNASAALRVTERVTRDEGDAQELFWREIGLEVPAEAPAEPPEQPESGPELLPELDQVLSQVAEDLETVSEKEAWNALAFLEGLEEADTGSTLILQAKSGETSEDEAAPESAADEAQAGDKVDDFLDFLMSAPADTGDAP